ncbi:ATP-binding cassette domain-containing protein [Streptomyces sp. DSM 44917]|uniref:ATP-binding cassette domain-containing protein n=1 Tax=Streptomyces boetiae TaxID=3075541 RepID=A0ABU2L249_9ACTN|nr:ATP-binding cassette domain-containing protein [Streptomyces sp. DSM 44917]MDT0305634.1 ATP-binding cassette domain-containing protein [Streptomyces sp. DSM 44917]
MIQAIGLTSAARRGRRPAVDDLTFEARAGQVTALLGPPGAGKSTALRLMLQLQPGRGVALFRGRPLGRVPHPAREVGVLLGDVPGHPRRTALGHLRMLAAVAGVPAARAGEVLEVVGLSGLADQPLGRFSRGMDRRLGLAVALLGDPHTLVLDDPGAGLSPRETAWLRGLLRGYAEQGGTVLTSAEDPRETARVADRVVSVDDGRLVADQTALDFGRALLRPRVAVLTPHADLLEDALARELALAAPAPGGERPEVVRESGDRISVFGSSLAAVGEIAHRHRVVVHQLADEVGDRGDRYPAGPLLRADGRAAAATAAPSGPRPQSGAGRPARLPPRLPALPPPGPAWPVRYELRRWAGVATGWVVMGAALLAGLVASLLLASGGPAPAERVLAGWAAPLPLPPAALAAGVLGALSFGHEFRYPALAPTRVPVPRRISLLAGKLVVATCAATLLCLTSVAVNSTSFTLLFGQSVPVEGSWEWALACTTGLSAGCAWAGLLAAGLFRSALAGLAAVALLPLAVAPALRAVLAGPAGRSLDGLPGRLHALTQLPFPSGVDRWLSASVRLASQPIGWALLLSLTVMAGAYALVSLRNGPRLQDE